MPRRHIPAKEILAGAALAGLAGLAWKEATRRPEAGPEPAVEPAQPPQPLAPEAEAPRARRALRSMPVSKLVGALVVISLMVAGMAFSAAPTGGLEEPARQASVSNPIGEAAVASRHFSDVPLHIVLPPRKAALPAPRPSERTVALARYAEVLGPTAMLGTLESQRYELSQRMLADSRVHIYGGGRSDLAGGRIDPRVIAVIEYLAEAYGEVTVSCLISGHSHFVHQSAAAKRAKRPLVVSAHVYGRAVDISAVGGVPIAGHQEPGGITEQAIRDILALPSALHPSQVISLLDLGGPSFPLPDHADHIHVGY
jgi:hypothetical protein